MRPTSPTPHHVSSRNSQEISWAWEGNIFYRKNIFPLKDLIPFIVEFELLKVILNKRRSVLQEEHVTICESFHPLLRKSLCPFDSVLGITFQKRTCGDGSTQCCAWWIQGSPHWKLLDLCFNSLMKKPVGWLKRKCHLIISGRIINENELEHINCR